MNLASGEIFNISGEFIISQTPDGDHLVASRIVSLNGTIRVWHMLNFEGGVVYKGSV